MRSCVALPLLIALLCPTVQADARQEANRQLDVAYREFQEVIKAPPAHPTAFHADLAVMLARVRCTDADRPILLGLLNDLDKLTPPKLPPEQKPLLAHWYPAMILGATGDREQAMKHWSACADLLPRIEFSMPIARKIYAHGLACFAVEWGEYDKALALAKAHPMFEDKPGDAPLDLLRAIRTRGDRALYHRAITEALAAPVKPDEKDDLLRRVAQARANVGDFAGAFETAKPIPPGYPRLSTHLHIARKAEEAGDDAALKQALLLAVDASDDSYRFGQILQYALVIRERELFAKCAAHIELKWNRDTHNLLHDGPPMARGYIIFDRDRASCRRIINRLTDFTKNRADSDRETYEAILARAACHAALGEHDQVADLVSRVPAKHLELAETFDDVQDAYLILDDFTRAIELVEKHLKPGERRFYIKHCIDHALRRDRFDLALEQTGKFAELLEQERQWRTIARRQTRHGKHADALAWIDKLPSPRSRLLARLAVAEQLLGIAPNRYMTVYED